MSDSEAGWQPDPTGKHDHRYWDGSQWTDNVADAGVAGTDAYGEPVPEVGAEPTEPEADPTLVQPVESGDPTATWSTAATPPAAPPPYVPPSPVDGGGDGDGDGGSKRGLVIGGAILAVVALAVLAFLALGGDDDSDVRAELASAIQDDESLDVSDQQAECIADLVVDAAGEDAFDDTDFDAEDPPPEFTAAVAEVGITRLVEECDLGGESAFGADGSTDGSDASTDGTDDSTDGTDDGDEESTDLAEGFADGNIEDIIADTYEEMFGLDREKAECLAGKMSEAIENGDLSEEQAMTEVFDFLSDCDISMEELGGN